MIDAIRIGVLLIIVFVYALFDVFNKRNVPNIFAYATVLVGVALTLTYPMQTIELSALYAIIIAALGYATYRTGILGAGDTFEFLFISLAVPMQVTPILIGAQQIALPFILSVFIATGYATILITPVYYIIRAKRKTGVVKIDRRGTLAAALMIVAYLILIVLLNYISGNTIVIAAVLLLIAIPSAVILIFKDALYEGMAEDVYPSQLEEGDMIATSMMSKSDIAYFKKRSKHFERLATKQVIKEIRGIRRKIPVYEHAIPLALFTFIGVVVSLLIGNIILLLL